MHTTTEPPKAETLILELFKARSAAKAEKARFADAVARRGGWSCRDHEDEDSYDPCYRNPRKPLCEDCTALQPFWEKSRKANIAAGAALRKVNAEGRRLFMKSIL